MSTHINDFAAAVAVHQALAPSTHVGAVNGATVDLISADGPCFAVQQVGTFEEGPTWDGAIEQSADGSSWSAISGATFTSVTEGSDTQVIRFTRTARYVRYVGTVTGGTPDLALAVIIGQQRKLF
jgi:hypothetical protein